MKLNNKYACLVTLYNPDEECLEQLEIYNDTFDKLVIFDNSPKKADWLEDFIKSSNDATYFGDGQNYGITESLNKTISYVSDLGFEYLATMDQDSVFLQDDIHRMFKHIDENNDNDIAIFATNFRKRYQGKEEIEYSEYRFSQSNYFDVTFHLTSGNFLYLPNLADILPLDDLFIAFVDFDLDFELHIRNKKIRVFGDCSISQQIGNSIKSNALVKHGLTNMSIDRFYYMMRNNLYFSKKYKDYKEATKFARKKRIIYYMKIILSEKHKIAKIKMMRKGRKDFKKGILGQMK